MLKVQFKEKTKAKFYYGDLKVGDVFIDESSYLCIKAFPDECLRFDGNEWSTVLIDETDIVKPIEATLRVED